MSIAVPRPQAEESLQEIEESNRIEAAPETDERPAPSWFPLPYRREAPEELAERYRNMQQKPRRASLAGSREHEEFNRGFEPAQARPNAGEPGPRARPPAAIRNGPGKSFIIASLAASVTGGLIGLAATQFETIKQAAGDFAGATLASFQQKGETVAAKPAAAAANKTVISKKPVATATLEVADASGALNSMIPLILRAEPAAEGQTLALRISGLPEDAYLTAGTRVSGNSWLLNPGQERNVKLVVPKASTPKFDVAVAAIETGSGELAAPMKELTVAIDDLKLQVVPANAPPETAAIQVAKGERHDLPVEAVTAEGETRIAAVTPEASDLLRKGDLLLKSGDLGAARQFYERAYAQGAAAGAMGVAKTYDPVVFAELNVQGIAPDPAKAMEWYRRAEDRGLRDAAPAIEALQALGK
ncbi:MAG: hypothetical protein ACT4SY_09405 [Hyphomicrobiales bacterium]